MAIQYVKYNLHVAFDWSRFTSFTAFMGLGAGAAACLAAFIALMDFMAFGAGDAACLAFGMKQTLGMVKIGKRKSCKEIKLDYGMHVVHLCV